MLRTIYDMYEDYIFNVEETNLLREECLTLKSRVIEHLANRALRKLIYGCDQALKANCSLMFVCD